MPGHIERNVSPAHWLGLQSTAGSETGLTLLSKGFWNSSLKLPISQEILVCLEAHRIYSPVRYQALLTSVKFHEALNADLPSLKNGAMFLGETSHWHFLMNGISTLETASLAETPIIYIDEAITVEQESFILAVAGLARGASPSIQRIPQGNYSIENVSIPWVERYPVEKLKALVNAYCDKNHVSSGNDRIVYVTRSTASTRRLVNEDEVIGEIRRHHDLTVVDCSLMPIREQISLFRGAKVIIGPHGAGLTNAVFMRSPALIVEFYHSLRQPFFEWLANNLMCGYRAVEGTRQDGRDAGRQDDADFLVDPLQVLKALGDMN